MFCLDYSVNQKTEGNVLCRLHDDFWFWGSEKDCVKAWGALTNLASVMGLEINNEKTGASFISHTGKTPQSLPAGFPTKSIKGISRPYRSF